MRCTLCPHLCEIEEGKLGFCKARTNIGGKIVDENYGKITSIALDPIEKKPLKRFCPGSKILSIGSYGCNLSCPFCQNFEISQINKDEISYDEIKPEEMVNMALSYLKAGNIGIAFTYNEPLISYEYVLDTSKLAKEKGLKTVVVTNGMINGEYLEKLVPYVDAFNIDLKGFTQEFYSMCGGYLETVKNSIRIASKYSHVEITTLIIPGHNDSDEEMKKIAEFISSVSSDIPLHITRFFPCYIMSDLEPTEVDTIYHLTEVAKKYLKYVYPGNV